MSYFVLQPDITDGEGFITTDEVHEFLNKHADKDPIIVWEYPNGEDRGGSPVYVWTCNILYGIGEEIPYFPLFSDGENER